jgi:hypothetical protein
VPSQPPAAVTAKQAPTSAVDSACSITTTMNTKS